MTQNMRAMLFNGSGQKLLASNIARPEPGPGQLLVRIHACGVCRTDLHVLDGELAQPKLPLVLGHEVAGVVAELGAGVEKFAIGQRVGVPWLGWTCGQCEYCQAGRENLCPHAKFTGYTLDGGYAEYAVVDQRYCFPLPESFSDAEAAPLLCAGLIGYRALRKTGEAQRIGIYGFGAAAHIVTQLARYEGREIYAFVRPGDDKAAAFARELGAVWAGASDAAAPVELDSALIFAPVGALVPTALRAVRPGGRVVCAGIHMSDIPAFPYEILWHEREIVSVANLTRRDGEEFFALVPKVPMHSQVVPYPMADANRALDDLRHGRFSGAAVLVCDREGAPD
jgi:propanol-preferring alcohol dehydrogenase